tara:strand:- start:6001 stop:6414 length:414 start_codon:yes stop_codon:yes gene_type:complete
MSILILYTKIGITFIIRHILCIQLIQFSLTSFSNLGGNMKNLKIAYHVLLIMLVSLSLYFNYSASKDIEQAMTFSYDSMMLNSQTSMQLETALEILSNEGPIEIERIARKVGREEAIKVMQEFAENFNNLTVSDNED